MLIGLALAGVALVTGATAGAYAASEPARLRRAAKGALRTVRRGVTRLRTLVEGAELALRRAAGDYAQDQHRARVAATPLEELRRAGVSNVRWSALEEAGVRTLADAEQRDPKELEAIPGVGAGTASKVSEGARALVDRLREEPVDLPAPDAFGDESVRPFGRAAWSLLRVRERARELEEPLARESEAVADTWVRVKDGTRFRDWVLRRIDEETLADARARVSDARARVERLERDGALDTKELEKALRPPSDDAIESEFRARYADYAAVFEEALAGRRADGSADLALHGPTRGLPAEVAAKIEAFPLDPRGLQLTLRRYQEFGAKYLLVQERTLLGDEMGLGKTVQALAAMAHLEHATGGAHFLVVCPASILRNWSREAETRTRLGMHLLHGSDRDAALARWFAEGGVALTSYGTLRRLDLAERMGEAGVRAALCVVDEAHYAKNPDAARSLAVQEIAPLCDRICLMTGTPLENSLVEFKNLVQLVSPEIAAGMPEEDEGFARISGHVAPVYLRRNQPDVLRELPERIEMEEWIDLGENERGAYRDAVVRGDYMAMRRTATVGDGRGDSAKLHRFGELLAEYRASGRKVLVFSFFLDVLSVLEQRFDAVGTLQGSLSPDRRQELVDRFQAEEGHALLLSQIEAGGVGLNIQAASVVVLMEPQWKPSTEAQAIARAHRMGQTEHVLVHRLLARECVDERMLLLLSAKRDVFDRHARPSELKDASAEATERGFAQTVIEEERARLAETEGV